MSEILAIDYDSIPDNSGIVIQATKEKMHVSLKGKHSHIVGLLATVLASDEKLIDIVVDACTIAYDKRNEILKGAVIKVTDKSKKSS